MEIIKGLIADLNAILQRIETEVGIHPMQATAGASVKEAATALAQHPQATAAPSAIVSPGKEAPTETTAPVASASPASTAPIGDAGTAGNTAAPAIETAPPAAQTPATPS